MNDDCGDVDVDGDDDVDDDDDYDDDDDDDDNDGEDDEDDDGMDFLIQLSFYVNVGFRYLESIVNHSTKSKAA